VHHVRKPHQILARRAALSHANPPVAQIGTNLLLDIIGLTPPQMLGGAQLDLVIMDPEIDG